MAVAPGECRLAAKDAEDGDMAERCSQTFFVGVRADAVEDDTADRNLVGPGGVAVHECGDGLVHRRCVYDEDDGRPGEGSDRGRAGEGQPGCRSVGAVEQAHDAFDDEDVAVFAARAAREGRRDGGERKVSRFLEGRPVARRW